MSPTGGIFLGLDIFELTHCLPFTRPFTESKIQRFLNSRTNTSMVKIEVVLKFRNNRC
jgi:hypothetical protein